MYLRNFIGITPPFPSQNSSDARQFIPVKNICLLFYSFQDDSERLRQQVPSRYKDLSGQVNNTDADDVDDDNDYHDVDDDDDVHVF